MTMPARALEESRPTEMAWLQDWFGQHGFACVPVEQCHPVMLALSLAVEFESWCENEGIPAPAQRAARQVSERRLRAMKAPHGPLRDAARDVAAWSDLRTGPRRYR